MNNLSTFSKVMVGFIAGAFVAGSVAVAVTPDMPPTKVCVDNRTKALYSATNGSCTKTRTLMEVAGSGVNVESIASAVSPSVVSIAVSATTGSGSGSGVIYRTNASSSFIITNNHVIESAATSGSVRVELNNGDYEKATIVGRDSNPQKDKENAEKLLASEKNHAENLMIVDLLRNDLSKNCIPGSINVKALCELKSYSNFHHLESIIEGTLKPHSTLIKLLKDSFPGGSITGTPKTRSMEIISDLEPHRRDIYCGSIGYIGFNHNMDTNIAIRTIIRKDNKLHFYSGGGIVAQSNAKNEFEEIAFKASNIRKWINFFKKD